MGGVVVDFVERVARIVGGFGILFISLAIGRSNVISRVFFCFLTLIFPPYSYQSQQQYQSQDGCCCGMQH